MPHGWTRADYAWGRLSERERWERAGGTWNMSWRERGHGAERWGKHKAMGFSGRSAGAGRAAGIARARKPFGRATYSRVARPVAAGRGRLGYTQGVRARTGGFTGIERKFYDTSLVGFALTAPTDSTGGEHDQSATICMNSIVQGDGESERDGRKATIQSAYVWGNIRVAPIANPTAGVVSMTCYVALVLDTQTNGAQLSSEQVFKNDSANAFLAANPMRNMQFTQRFRILDTATVTIDQLQMAWNGANMEASGMSFPFKLSSNVVFSTQYSGTTETVANITDNSLHIIAFTSSVGAAPLLDYNARIRFVG